MEDTDPADEWAIQEYSAEHECDKLSWIVNKGLSAGKKVLVTGLVISSAPLVLPSLMVISVIGFACSVPSGLFLASYACTNKLMSKLLPGSTPPHFLLDYGTQYRDEEFENYDIGGGGYMGLKGCIDMGKEQDEIYGGKALVRDEYERGGLHINDVNETVEENRYREGVGEYEDEKEEAAVGIEVKIESIREEEGTPTTEGTQGQLPVDEVHAVVVETARDEISGVIVEEEEVPAFAVTNVAIELCQNRDVEEEQELVRETRGLLEKIREEGMTDNGDNEQQSVEKLSEAAGEEDRKVEEIGLHSENKNYYGTARIEHAEGLLGKRDGDNVLESGKSEVEKDGATNSGSASKKPKVQMHYLLEGGRANENITSSVQQDYQLNKEKEAVISTNADAREIADESGFDLYDDNKIDDLQQKSSADRGTVEGEHECNGNARVSSQKDLGVAFHEVMYNERKIWEQIVGMRKIVGYKAAKQATCFEELKALYLFTGVEPPSSFKDPCDLQEINDKLRFLMSIIGVK